MPVALAQRKAAPKEIRCTMNVTDNPVWKIKLQSAVQHMGAAERRVAEYVLQHPENVVNKTITEIAEESHSSEATVVRFCRRLGYKGFQGLKIAIAQDIVPPIQVMYEGISENDSVEDIKNKVFYSSIEALQDTLKLVDTESLSRAIDAIYEARNIDIYGMGGSGVIARDVAHKFLKIGVRSNVYVDSHLQILSATNLGPKDVVIGISHSGNTKDIVKALDVARHRGATTICITHYAKSPITLVSDIQLYTTAKEMMFRSDGMTSRIAQLAIIDSLYVGVGLKMGERALENLKNGREASVDKGF